MLGSAPSPQPPASVKAVRARFADYDVSEGGGLFSAYLLASLVQCNVCVESQFKFTAACRSLGLAIYSDDQLLWPRRRSVPTIQRILGIGRVPMIAIYTSEGLASTLSAVVYRGRAQIAAICNSSCLAREERPEPALGNNRENQHLLKQLGLCGAQRFASRFKTIEALLRARSSSG